MSVHSIIARPTPDGFSGRYVHHDGHPTRRVPLLLALHQVHFAQDLDAMSHQLLDAHPAGWSRLGTDFTHTTNPTPPSTGPTTPNTAQCYCHTYGCNEQPPLTQRTADPRQHAWLYLLRPNGLHVIQADPRNPTWRSGHLFPWARHRALPLPATIPAPRTPRP